MTPNNYHDAKEKASQRAARLIESNARWQSSSLGQITEALEQQLLIEMLGPIAGKTLLDVGCGDGVLASKLARRGVAVTGLDPEPTMIAAHQRSARGKSHKAMTADARGKRVASRRRQQGRQRAN